MPDERGTPPAPGERPARPPLPPELDPRGRVRPPAAAGRPRLPGDRAPADRASVSGAPVNRAPVNRAPVSGGPGGGGPASGPPPSGPPPSGPPRGSAPGGATSATSTGGRRPRRDPLSAVFRGARIVAAVLSLAVLIGAGWFWAEYRNFNDQVRRVAAITNATLPAADPDGKDQNILIVGNDDRDTATNAELKAIGLHRDGGSLNTDTMMLLHVPANGKKASAISFPRDSWVNIPGYGMNRLNSAYADGVNANNGSKAAGARLLVETIQDLTGLSIDHFVQIDLLGFYRISNAIGGITVCLNAAQNATTENDDPSDPHPKGYSGINLKKGINVIKGKQALAFVRQRHGLPGGDLDRIKRQQYFLAAVFRKVTTAGVLLNPLKMQHLLKAVSSSLQMDGTTPGHQGLNPLSLGQQLQNLAAGNLTFTTIPTTPATIDGKSVLTVDSAQLPAFIAKVLGSDTDSAYGKARTVAPSKVKVDVLNGTSTSAWAATNASTLAKAGFRTTVGDATQSTATLIRYPPGMEAQAKTLAGYVKGATATPSTDVSLVTLVLGTDGDQASATKTKTATTSKKAPTRTAAQIGCIN